MVVNIKFNLNNPDIEKRLKEILESAQITVTLPDSISSVTEESNNILKTLEKAQFTPFKLTTYSNSLFGEKHTVHTVGFDIIRLNQKAIQWLDRRLDDQKFWALDKFLFIYKFSLFLQILYGIFIDRCRTIVIVWNPIFTSKANHLSTKRNQECSSSMWFQ